ncbi:hypothetical protein [Ruminococcus sp.]|uniref:hypothetical protein n=1 Tax=Ruminococcus sp. TaxID=41978 RepID=UPI0025EB647C|nr:hypothetical protein [Ruminococcus sp.]
MKQESLIKNIFLTALFWLANWAALFLSSMLLFIHSEESYKYGHSGFIGSTYKVIPLFYTIGAVMCIISVSLITRKLLGKRLECVVSQFSAKWTVIWYVQALIGMAGQFIVYMISMLLVLGLLDSIGPEILQWFIIPLLVYQLGLLIYLHVKVNNKIVENGIKNCEEIRLAAER